MKLQELAILKDRYLSRLHDEVSKVSSNVYSTSVDPYKLGELLDLDKAKTERIVVELVQNSLLESTLGMRSIYLNDNSIKYLTYLEMHDSSKACYDAYYLSKEEFNALQSAGRNFDPHYVCHIKTQILLRYTPEIFDCKILLRKGLSNEYYLISDENERLISIMRDYYSQKSGLFTLDKISFYEIESLRKNSEGIYESTNSHSKNIDR